MPKFSSTYQPKHPRKPITSASIPKMRSDRIKNLTVEQYKGLSDIDLAALAQRAFTLAEKRVKNIQKKGLTSPALYRYFAGGLVEPKQTSDRASLLHQFAQLKRFLSAKTSTVQGIEKSAKSISSRIFGPESEEEFTSEQASRFWAAYREFMNQYPAYYDESARIQQMLGTMTFWKKRDFNAQDIDEMIERLEGRKRPFTPYGGSETRSYSFGGSTYGTTTTELDLDDFYY